MDVHRLGDMLRIPYFLDSRLTDVGEVLAFRTGSPLPAGRLLVPISVTDGVKPRAIELREGLRQLTSLVTS
jgi:hypothetical protein